MSKKKFFQVGVKMNGSKFIIKKSVFIMLIDRHINTKTKFEIQKLLLT